MTTVFLPNQWTPYPWQREVLEAREKGIDRFAIEAHRRAGKDALALNMTAVEMHKQVGTYVHCFPYATMARRALWRESDDEGVRFLERAFPEEIRKSTREQELSIEFLNGSVWQAVSAEDPRAPIGTNVKGVVFSEYALYDSSEVWDYVRPILARNGGWAMFISTYRGANHHYQLVRLNRNNPAWFVRELDVTKTRDNAGRPLISQEMIEAERRSGMSEALIQQEFYSSPVAALSGAYYQAMMRKARDEGRVGSFAWDENRPVLAAFDLGYADHAVAVFFQTSEPDKTTIIGSKAWQFTPPSDIAQDIKKVFPWGSRISTVVLPHDGNRPGPSGDTWVSVFDQHRLAQDEIIVLRKGQGTLHSEISHTQMRLSRFYFDNAVRPWTNEHPNNDVLLEAMAAYRTEAMAKRPGVYSRNPLHDFASHWADAVRYLTIYRYGDYMAGWGPTSKSREWNDRALGWAH